VLLGLMLSSVLPLAIAGVWRRIRGTTGKLQISMCSDSSSCCIMLGGMATSSDVASAILAFRDAMAEGGQLTVDVTRLRMIDARFFGLLLMVRKQLNEQGRRLQFAGVSPWMERAFRLNRFSFLLPSHDASSKATHAMELGNATTRQRA
jgi:N-acetylglucosaminyldiphosphoundecaprenol N-acetyl-beta-D-mannosaminyltransferase